MKANQKENVSEMSSKLLKAIRNKIVPYETREWSPDLRLSINDRLFTGRVLLYQRVQ
jgi:hypothetical protein